MSMKPDVETERGFRDILGEEAERMDRLVDSARKTFKAYDYRPIILPIVEPAELFVRSVGGTTDIVEKEMFFVTDGHEDTGARESCLRPEGTASAVRAYIKNGLHMSNPIQRLYYTGPMFRNERPQKGRYRQFHQIGAEMFGVGNVRADVEVIAMLWAFLRSVADGARLRLVVNSLGCPVCRPNFTRELLGFLQAQRDALCEDCRRRLASNPMRVLDCKNEGCRKVLIDAPNLTTFWCDPCRAKVDGLNGGLEELKITPTWNNWLVRGLDYYTRTVFEVAAEDGLGSQNAVAAGGRYDGLVEALGGPSTPALGFAIGVERLAMLVSPRESPQTPRLYIGATSDAMRTQASDLAERLRRHFAESPKPVRIRLDLEDRKFRRQLDEAQSLGCEYTVILGDEEMKNGRVIVRDMKASKQEEVLKDDLVPHLMKRLGI
ncbi:MAG: histidine--tRNA ligase [Nitrospirae bacterium]|nr:histidine--tRNA ligase [Nitrospirota bacterium]